MPFRRTKGRKSLITTHFKNMENNFKHKRERDREKGRDKMKSKKFKNELFFSFINTLTTAMDGSLITTTAS